MMTGSLVMPQQNCQRSTKVKTGCATCRIRKVKCDENKPYCRRCVDTGRTCDGYESRFRLVTCPPIIKAPASDGKPWAECQGNQLIATKIAPHDIDQLNRYFSIKTILNVKLGCDEEARQILQASLTDPLVRHAVASLRALRKELETSGEAVAEPPAQQAPSYDYGIQQYCMALGGLATNLSSSGSNGLKSALLCCQLFISIEQVRGNYASMAQHMIQGLRILYECPTRPRLVSANESVPAYYDQLPFLDVFLIKLFAAPCKFADPPATADISRTTAPACPISQHQRRIESRDLRTIAPYMREKLTRIAELTLGFLHKMSQAESAERLRRLQSERASLLDSLESWLIDLELVRKKIWSPSFEPISVSFMRLFHQILKVILMGVLDFSTDRHVELQTEYDQLHGIASIVGERVRGYRMCSATKNGREE